MLMSEVLLEEGNLAIPIISGSPGAAGVAEGQLLAQDGPNDRKGLWRWNGSAWVYFPLSPIFATASPQGSITPDGKGQQVFNATDSSLWLANGTTSSGWVKISAGDGSGGLFAHWTFDDDTWADEIAGRSLVQEGSGTISIVAGQVGDAAELPGGSNTFFSRTNADMSINGSNWTFSFYMNFDEINFREVITVKDSITASNEMVLDVADDGTYILRLSIYDDANTSIAEVYSELESDVWYFVTAKLEDGEASIDVDGSISTATVIGTPAVVSSPKLLLGFNPDEFSSVLLLDDVKLFK